MVLEKIQAGDEFLDIRTAGRKALDKCSGIDDLAGSAALVILFVNQVENQGLGLGDFRVAGKDSFHRLGDALPVQFLDLANQS